MLIIKQFSKEIHCYWIVHSQGPQSQEPQSQEPQSQSQVPQSQVQQSQLPQSPLQELHAYGSLRGAPPQQVQHGLFTLSGFLSGWWQVSPTMQIWHRNSEQSTQQSTQQISASRFLGCSVITTSFGASPKTGNSLSAPNSSDFLSILTSHNELSYKIQKNLFHKNTIKFKIWG